MATTTVLYRLVGQDAGASRAFGRVGGSASAMGKAMRVAALGTVAVGAVLVKAADDAITFNSSMLKVQTQAGASAKDVKALSVAVLKLAPSTQQGPDQLAASLYHLKSIGLDNASAMKDLKVASDLAAVGGSNLEDTTNALGGAWRSGIKGAGSFAQSAATVNAVIGAGNMKMSDFVEAIGTGILPAAKTFGVSLGSVGSALALMTDEGIPATDAATRLKMSLSLLAAPSRVASKQLAMIHLTGLQLADTMRSPAGLVGAIGLLKSHLDASGLSLSKQAILLSHAFGGGRSSSAILTMINNYDVLKKKQDQVNASLSKYGPAVAAQRKTAQAQLAMLESTLQVMSIKLGNALLPPLTRFVTWINGTLIPQLTGFVTWISDTLIPRIGTVRSRILGMIPVAQIKSDLKSLQSNVSDFLNTLFPKAAPKASAVAKHVAGLGSVVSVSRAQQVFGAPMPRFAPRPARHIAGLGSVLRVSRAQSAFGAPMPRFAPKTGPAKSQGAQLADQLKSSISGGIGNINWNKIGGQLGKALVLGISAGLNSLGDLGATIIKLMGSIDWTNVGKAVGGQAIGFALGFIGNLGAQLFSADFWKKHWLDVILGILAIIPIGRVAGVLGKVFGHIPILKIFAPLLKGVEHLGGWVEKGLGKLLKPIGKFLGNLGVAFTLGFEEIFPKAAGAIGRLLEKITGPFARFQARAIGWGRSLIGGFVSGAENGAIAVGKWVGRFFKSVINWFKGIFGIHSPARTMLPIGGALIMGFIQGAINIAVGIAKFLYQWVFQPVDSFFGGAPMWLFNRGKDLVMGLVHGAQAAFGFVDKLVLQPMKIMFGWLWDVAIRPVLANIVAGFLAMAGAIIHGAAAAFGFLPGIGGKLKSASKAFDKFAASVNDALGGIQPKTVPVTVSFNGVPQGKITGHTFTSTTGFTYAKGGEIPGWLGKPNKDSVPVLAMGGEFIVNKKSTQRHKRLLEAINSGDVKQYGKGGMVGFTRAAVGDMGTAAKIDTAAQVKALASAYAKAYNTSHAVQGLAWARSQIGMPYQWGGNGNPSWDCSGFQSAIESVMRGEAPHRRWATGAFNGNTAPPGWVQNAKAPFMIGVTNAGVGHTAGTINGTNVEMSTVGARVGGGARGANDSMFPMHYGLVGFDKGGVARGKGYMPKMVHAPERVLSPRQTEAFEKLVAQLGQPAGAGAFTRLGAQIPAGVAAGVDRHASAAHRAVADLAKGGVKAFCDELGIASPSKKYRSLGAYIDFGLVQGLTGSLASVKAAGKRVASALYVQFGTGHAGLQRTVARDNAQLLALATGRDKVAARLKAANSTLASLQKLWAETQKSVADNIMQSSTVVTDAPANGVALDAARVVANFAAQTKKALAFAALLRKLQARGLNSAAVQQIAGAGVDGGYATAQALSSAGTSQIRQLNAMQKTMVSASDKVGGAVADSMYGAGIKTAQGLVAGLKSQEKAIDAEMLRIAKGMQKAIKAELGIHSPSRVFDYLGRTVPQGVAQGVRHDTHHAVRAVRAMSAQVRRAGGGAGAAPAAAGAGAGGGEFTGDLYLDSGQFLGVVRGVVRPMIRASEQEQARRVKVGRR